MSFLILMAMSNLKRLCLFLLFFALSLWEIIERIKWVFSRHYLINADFFYYLQELTYRLKTGTSYYHGHSLLFDFQVSLSKLLNTSPTDTIKISILLVFALFTLGIILLSISKKNWFLLPLFICALWSSNILFYINYEYQKQASAMALFLFGVVSLNRYFFYGKKQRNFLFFMLGLFFFTLSLLTHIFTAFLSLPILLIYLRELKNIKIKYMFYFLLVTIMLINLKPLMLLSKNVEFSLNNYLFFNKTSYFVEEIESLFLIFLAVLIYKCILRGKSLIGWFFPFIFVLLNLPIWKNEIGGYAPRLAESSVWIFYVMLAVEFNLSSSKKYRRLLVLLSCLLIAINVYYQTHYPNKLNIISPKLSISAFEKNKHTLQTWISKDSTVLALQSITYRVHYFLNRKSEIPLGIHRGNPVYVIISYKPPTLSCEDIDRSRLKIQSIDCFHLENSWYIIKTKNGFITKESTIDYSGELFIPKTGEMYFDTNINKLTLISKSKYTFTVDTGQEILKINGVYNAGYYTNTLALKNTRSIKLSSGKNNSVTFYAYKAKK